MVLVVGFEPTTHWLQISSSTNWAIPANMAGVSWFEQLNARIKTSSLSHLTTPLWIMAVSIGIEPMERFHVHGLANRCFNHSANLPKWQELKDSNPYKMIWNHLCYRYTKLLKYFKNGSGHGIEPCLINP